MLGRHRGSVTPASFAMIDDRHGRVPVFKPMRTRILLDDDQSSRRKALMNDGLEVGFVVYTLAKPKLPNYSNRLLP